MTGSRFSGFNAPVAPTNLLYGALGATNTTSDLYTIDPNTGASTSVGASGFALTGLSFRPSDNVLFGVTSNNSAADPQSLVTVDIGTGAGTLVGSLGLPFGIADIAFRSDDALYGYSARSDRTLYTIDTTTGIATQVSATQVPGPACGYGLSFTSGDVLYLFPDSDLGVFYIVDETTGGLTAQPTLTGVPGPATCVGGVAFDSNDLLWGVGPLVGDAWLLTIDTGTATTTHVGLMGDTFDALAWDMT